MNYGVRLLGHCCTHKCAMSQISLSHVILLTNPVTHVNQIWVAFPPSFIWGGWGGGGGGHVGESARDSDSTAE